MRAWELRQILEEMEDNAEVFFREDCGTNLCAINAFKVDQDGDVVFFE